MLEWIGATLGPWTWWVVGLVLLALEIAVPGTFFLWFGVSALVVGAISLAVDWGWLGFGWGWQVQSVVWLVVAVVCLIASRLLLRKQERAPGTEPEINARAARYYGRSYVLLEPIVEGSGRLNIDDTVWRISGPDCPAGTRVVVAGSDGARLKVTVADQ